MWILIVIALAFLGWYFIAPAGEAAAEAEAPAPPETPAEPATGGDEFASAQPGEAGEAPAEAPASGGDDDDPFKAH